MEQHVQSPSLPLLASWEHEMIVYMMSTLNTHVGARVYMMLTLNTHVGAAPVAGAAVQPVARVAAARTQVQGPLNLNKRIIIQVIFSSVTETEPPD